jgi:arylsulfatase A-like enzyme
VADDLGYGDLGSYGSSTIRTPHLDRLAAEGLKHTQFYQAASLCTPARAAMLTGRLPVRSGTYTARPPPQDSYFRVYYPSSSGCTDPSEVTVAHALQAAGYATALVGKWHLGHRLDADVGCLPGDGRRGFDYFFGLPYSHEEGYPGPFPEGLVWPPVPLYENATILEQPFNASDLTPRYTSTALAFVDAAQARGEPYFLHLAYEAPHVPLFTSPAFANVSRRGLYGDAVQEMDSSVGELMAAIRSGPSATNTVVVFTSDNGAWLNANSGLSAPYVNARSGIGACDGGSNGPFYEGKGSTWEGGLRVPALVWWPGRVPAGATSFALASGLDLLPTLLALANVPLPPNVPLDGHDLSGVWLGASAAALDDYGPWWGSYMFFWREATVYALRTGKYKVHYITRSGFNASDLGTVRSPPLVFDVESDPGEAHPLATDPASVAPETQAVLDGASAALAAHLASLQPLPTPQYDAAQNWSVVPCCPRATFDPEAAVAYARAGEWGMALWDECVCTRE